MSFGKHSGQKFSKPPEIVKKSDDICIFCDNRVFPGAAVCSDHLQGVGDKHNLKTLNKKR